MKDRITEMAGAGDREWIIDSGVLESLKDGYLLSRSVYSIRPIEEGRFELLIEDQGDQLYMIIQRTKSGFCKAYGGDYSQPQSDPYFAECFKRSDKRERIDEKTPVMKVAAKKMNDLYVDGKDGFGAV